MLTFDQAACAVYGYPPTEANQKKALSQLQEAYLVPVYMENPSVPAAIGKDVQQSNPRKYKLYAVMTGMPFLY